MIHEPLHIIPYFSKIFGMRQPGLFLVSLMILSLLIGYNVYSSFQNFNELVYPLDDAYIHMAISRNLEEYGVWGVTRFGFSSTSSSILHTLLLALSFSLFGVTVWMPLVLNWLAALGLLWLTTGISLRFMSWKTALVFQIALVVLVPFAGMVVLGMEHTLQILFCTWFLWLTWRKWNGEQVSSIGYALIALLAVATRYESAFLIAITGLIWWLVYKNIRQMLWLALAAALPILVFGLYAVAQGGYFVPNSLLAKSNYVNAGLMGFVTEASKKIINNSLLAALCFIPLVYWLMFPAGGMELRKRVAHLIFLVAGATAVLHQLFASFGWMFRYEAYLIALLFVSVVITWQDWKQMLVARSTLTKAVVLLFGFVLCLPLLIRIQIPSFSNRASKNIHDQHLQMAAFVQQHFPDAGIAMNDIGTTSFLNENMKLFDMEGLGTLEVLKIKKQLDSAFLVNYTRQHGISIGIFYPHLYQGKIPSTWEQVGSWTIPDRFVAAGSEVGFYVIDPSARARMIRGLQQFASQLPAGVVQKGIYQQALRDSSAQ